MLHQSATGSAVRDFFRNQPFIETVTDYREACDYVVKRYSMPNMTRIRRSPKELLPLSAPMFQVLIAVADGEKHGYAIIKEVSRRTGGKVKLGAGTLYAIIRKFESEGVIEETEERPDPALDDERRRYYRLTSFGREVARAEALRMEESLRMAAAKNLIPKLKSV